MYMVAILQRIAKNWKVKVAAQRILSLLPRKWGFELNEKLTGYVMRSGHRIRAERIPKGLDNIEMLYRETAFDINGKNVLEVGTGWHGVDLIIFFLLGARQITTVDHHQYLTLDGIRASVRYFKESKCLRRLEMLNFQEERWEFLKTKCTQTNSLTDLLNLLNVKYIISDSSNFGDLPVEPDSIDLFYSESVLQRIPGDHLQRFMKYVGDTLMKEHAVFFHRTDQKDINSQDHVDSNLWGLRYLKYSDFFFNTFISGKLNSQNRLRESDFLEIIDKSTLSALYLESYLRKEDINRLRKVRLCRKFQAKDLQDLATRASKIVGTKKAMERIAPMKHNLIYI